MGLLPWIVVGAVVVVVFGFLAFWLFNYRKVGPSQVLVISGRTSTVAAPDGSRRKVGYRLQLGGGTFVMPFVEAVDTLPIEVFSVSIRCPEVLTSQGVLVSADAFAQVKAVSDEPLVHRAVENFLAKGSSGMTSVAQEVLEGHMRAALGRMKVEEIYTERDEFAQRVRQAAQVDFERLGLELLSFSLKDISDSQGYLEALGARRIAEVKRDATLAQAEMERDSAITAAEYRKQGDIARLGAEAELAEATRDFEMKRADFQASVNLKRAQADIAYDLERAKLSEELKKQEYQVRLTEKELAAKVEEQEIIRREFELEATVKRPAEAMHYQAKLEADTDAYRKEIEAKGKGAGIRLFGACEAEAITAKGKAEADAMKLRAEAWKQYTDAALAEMVIKQLPELARAVSEPLSKVEKIIMVGDNQGIPKITGQIASVLAQLPTVVESLTGLKLEDLLKRKDKKDA